jgi:hypothetical protein
MWRGGRQVLGNIQHCLTFWRPEAKNAFAAMREMGTKTFPLGGDTQNVTTMGARTRLGVGVAMGSELMLPGRALTSS